MNLRPGSNEPVGRKKKKKGLFQAAAWTLILFLHLGAASPILAMTLPQSPVGYSWHRITDLKAAVLLPEGWLFDSKASGNRYRYLLTKKKQEAGNNGSSATRLTIVAVRKPGREGDKGIAPSRLTAALFTEIMKHLVLERTQSVVQGPFATIRYQYVTASDGFDPVREYSLLVSNDATGTLYIFTFQAPLSDWEQDWGTITVVLDRLFLDDEI